MERRSGESSLDGEPPSLSVQMSAWSPGPACPFLALWALSTLRAGLGTDSNMPSSIPEQNEATKEAHLSLQGSKPQNPEIGCQISPIKRKHFQQSCPKAG